MKWAQWVQEMSPSKEDTTVSSTKMARSLMQESKLQLTSPPAFAEYSLAIIMQLYAPLPNDRYIVIWKKIGGTCYIYNDIFNSNS